MLGRNDRIMMVDDDERVVFAPWPEKQDQPLVNHRRRRFIAAGVLATLIVVLAIVLGVTLSQRDDGHSSGTSSVEASLSPAVISSPLLPTTAPASTPTGSPPAPPSLNSSNLGNETAAAPAPPTNASAPVQAPVLSNSTGLSNATVPSNSTVLTNSTNTPPALSPAQAPVVSNQSTPTVSTPAPTYDPVESAIRKAALFGGREFNKITYQLHALNWLKTNSTLNSTNITDTKLVQRYALACIYYASYAIPNLGTNLTFGSGVPVPPWNITTGWITDADECQWYGITCNANRTVTGIDLSGNNLTGTFPPEVTLLKKTLERLNLNNNYVLNVGDAGNAFLGLLTQLKYLYYGSTFFAYDGIPTAIGFLTNLIEYDCSYTVYYGKLQDEPFRNLTNLKYLDLEGNAYNSSIPSSISSLPYLKSFYAGNAFLSGSLDFLDGMRSINEIWLDQNPGLTGTIPREIGNLTTLTSLSVTYCNLHGTLPSEMGDMVAMEQMWFYGNHLNGTVPSSIGNLTSLQTFQIENNDITGTMPVSICRDVKPAGNLTILTADCGAGNTSKVVCNCCTCCGNNCEQRRNRRRLGVARI